MSDTVHKIVFLDRDTLPSEIDLKPFSFPAGIAFHPHTEIADVAARIADADIVITNKIPIAAKDIAAARRLKLVAVAATGTDVVDLAACRARDIVVSNVRNYAVNTVPEHTFALLLALRRSILAYHESVRAGRWEAAGQFCYFDYPIRDLAGATIGIIGDGVLGKAVSKLAEAFGMKVLFAAYKGSVGMGPLYTPFDDVIQQSDVLTLHCPLTAATRHLIGEPEFRLMTRHPLLINTARGGLVDEAALVKAMHDGTLGGAAFDVLTSEPPEPDHPFRALMDLPNFILTPHVAWASREAVQSLADQLIDNVEAFVAGNPVNQVVG